MRTGRRRRGLYTRRQPHTSLAPTGRSCSNPSRNAPRRSHATASGCGASSAAARKLLSERGEAAGVSLAKTTLDLYRELDRNDQARFFAALLADFSPDAQRRARGGAGVRRGRVGRQPGDAFHRDRAAAPGAAAAPQPRARRNRDDPAHARAAAGAEARRARARGRRLGFPPSAVVVVQPGLSADRARGLAHAGVPAGADHRARGGARDPGLERPAAAAGGRRPLLRLLPSGACPTSR